MCLKKLILLLISLCISYTYIYSQTPYSFPGFPKNFDHQRMPTIKSGVPVVADLDNDGNKEIIAVGGDYENVSTIPYMLHVIKTDGNEMNGFPKPYFQYIEDIAAGDINGDGYIDIAVRQTDTIDVIDRNGIHLPGFPIIYKTLDPSYWQDLNFINLYDLDNDGSLEIITCQYGALAVFDNHGHFKPGWPKPIVGRVLSNPAIGDLDNDGKAEIVCTQLKKLYALPYIDSPSINILRYDGSAFSNNWPIYHDSLFHAFLASPSIYIGASAGDSYIITTIQKGTISNPYISIKYLKYNIYAQLLDSIRFDNEAANNDQTMAMGDVNGDGILEYSMSLNPDLYLFSSDFKILPGWPQYGSGSTFRSTSVAKLTNGSELKIIIPGSTANDSGGFVYAYDKSGVPLNWSPLRSAGANNGLCLTDLNNDGSVEIVTTNAKWDTSLFISIWTVPGIAFNHNDFPWPEYCHDRYKSNQYGFIPPDEPNGIQPMSNKVPKEFSLYQNYPNPFNPSTAIKYTVKSSCLINLSVYDVLGRRVSEIVNENQRPGTYSVSFDGFNLSSGVYYYRLTADGDVIDTKKMILIK